MLRHILTFVLLVGSLSAQQLLPSKAQIETVDGHVRVYQIRVVRHITIDIENCGFIGYTYCEKGLIEVVWNPDISTTITHELLHAITDCKFHRLDTHDFIYRVSPKLVYLMKHNPDLAHFLEQAALTEGQSTEQRFAEVASCAK